MYIEYYDKQFFALFLISFSVSILILSSIIPSFNLS